MIHRCSPLEAHRDPGGVQHQRHHPTDSVTMQWLKCRCQEPCVLAWTTTRVLVDWPEPMTTPGGRTPGLTHKFGSASPKSCYKSTPELSATVVRTAAPTGGSRSCEYVNGVEENPYLSGGEYVLRPIHIFGVWRAKITKTALGTRSCETDRSNPPKKKRTSGNIS